MTALDKCWINCLQMTKWLSEQEGDTVELKRQYTKAHGLTLYADDFFCEFSKLENSCSDCPAVRIDRSFDCFNKQYHWEYYRKKYYRKLLELDKKRKQK